MHEQITTSYESRDKKVDRLLGQGRIPERFDPESDDRLLWRGHGMWGIVDMAWTKRLAQFIGQRRCLEIMAGRGWLSAALRAHGINIVATGRLSSSYDTFYAQGTVTEVEEYGAVEAVRDYAASVEVLVVSWPVADPSLYRALAYWPEGKPIVYIGEWYSTEPFAMSGCATDEFFHAVERDTDIDFAYPKGRQGIDIATVCYKKPKQQKVKDER